MVILDAYKTGRCFCYSKIFILVFGCYLPVYSTYYLKCNFTNFCHPHDSFWWRYHANNCYQCLSDKIYHCARDYDDPDVFKEGCAVEKICPSGEEPHLSFFKSGSRRKKLEEPIVHCRNCHDDNYFNDMNRASSTYSKCPSKKQNDCSIGAHKILCKPENSKEERFCRCDARKGYLPYKDKSHEVCSYDNYNCRNYECEQSVNGQPQQRLLNYTCAPFCPEGYDRLKEDSDVCEPVQQSSPHFTTQPLTTILLPNSNGTTTLPNSNGTTNETISTSNGKQLYKYFVGFAIALVIAILMFCIGFIIFKRRGPRENQPNTDITPDSNQDATESEQTQPMIQNSENDEQRRGTETRENQSNPDRVQGNEQVAKDLDQTDTILKKITKDKRTDFVRMVIQKNLSLLRDNLEPMPTIEKLYEKDAITMLDYKKMKNKNDETDQSRAIIDKLLTNGLGFYKSFIIALSLTNQTYCLDIIHDEERKLHIKRKETSSIKDNDEWESSYSEEQSDGENISETSHTETTV